MGEINRRAVPESENSPEAHGRTPLPLTAVRHAVGEVSKHLATNDDYRDLVEEYIVSDSLTDSEGAAVTAWIKPVSETMLSVGPRFASPDQQDR